MMDMLPDGWALIDPGEARSGSPLADISATPGIQRVGVAVQGSDDWHDTVVLTSTDVPDDMTDRQWLSAAVDESSRTLPGSYVVDVTPGVWMPTQPSWRRSSQSSTAEASPLSNGPG